MNIFQKLKIKIRNRVSQTKFKKNMLIILFILTILSLYLALGTISFVAEKNGRLDYEYMWICLLFLPISISSIILGIKYRRKGYLCKKNIVGGIIITILLLMYGILPFGSIDNDYSYVDKLEKIINFELPNTGTISLEDYSDVIISPSFELISKGYITFTDEKEIKIFEESISLSTIWKNKNTSYMQMQEPNSIIVQLSGKIYYLLFNKDENTYNTVPTKEGKYEMYFIMYDMDENKMYTLNYKYKFIPE